MTNLIIPSLVEHQVRSARSRDYSQVVKDIEEAVISKRLGWVEDPDPQQEKQVRVEVYVEIEKKVLAQSKCEGLSYQDREQGLANGKRKLVVWEQSAEN